MTTSLPTTLSRQTPPAGPIQACDGQGLKALAGAGLAWLEQHQQVVNALNVFPVPDGDTGTNMLLTMRAAYKEIVHSAEHSATVIIHQFAHGALMGARGNSGVILSQLWRGFARGIDGVVAFNTREMATGLREASDTAYKGVVKPVEGTILTVAREMAEEAAQAAAETGDLREMFERVVARSRVSVANTPKLLPILREAGVVDSGGQGLAYIFEGMLRFMRGEELEIPAALAEEAGLQSALAPGEAGYGYDVQFILKGHNLDVPAVRADIDAMGDSTLVVGDANTIKVHVHVHDPGVPLSYAVKQGIVCDVVVENMQEQYQQFVMNRLAPAPDVAGLRVPAPPVLHVPTSTGKVGSVIVASGDGLARVFASLGVAAIIPGGQTMNPATEDILRATESVAAEQVIVLPNNKNIVLTAEQARELSHKQLAVVPTLNIPQGIAAMLAFNPEASLGDNVARMQAAIQDVVCGEITTATRTVEIDGVAASAGQIIGLVNDALVTAGEDLYAVVVATLEHMRASRGEIITLYYGENVAPGDADTLAGRLRARFGQQQVEVVEGQQPHYFYILGTE